MSLLTAGTAAAVAVAGPGATDLPALLDADDDTAGPGAGAATGGGVDAGAALREVAAGATTAAGGGVAGATAGYSPSLRTLALELLVTCAGDDRTAELTAGVDAVVAGAGDVAACLAAATAAAIALADMALTGPEGAGLVTAAGTARLLVCLSVG